VWNPLAAVNALAERGHDVTVICPTGDSIELVRDTDQALDALVSPDVTVVRVRQPEGVMDPVLNRWPATRVAAPKRWAKVMGERVRGLHPDPERNGWLPGWRPAASAAARVLNAKAPFDLVVANILPAVSAGVALDLNTATGTPLVLVERDSWVFSPITGQPYADADVSRPLLEDVFRRAAQVWYVNTPLAELHRNEFAPWADKVREVRNGWDREFLPDRISPPDRTGRDGLTFRFVGQMLAGFPWDFLKEAWSLAREASPVVARSRLELVGRASRPDFGDEALGVVLTGHVSKTDLPDVYATTDVLVYLKEGGPMATSGKIYEYVGAGLPVVTSMDPDHDARRVLEGHPLWFDAAEHTPRGMAEALVRAAEHAPTRAETAAAHEHALGFRRDLVLGRAFDELEEALGW
jgi:glycosyltransferase involved in cell wall biosynthesis